MQIDNETFWTNYPHIVSLLLPPLQLGDGASEDEITAAESRLGIRFPALLREFYARTSRREDINATYNRLISLNALKPLDNGYLVFYVENQEVEIYGIDPSSGNDDPPVWARTHDPSAKWKLSYDSLSIFLVLTLLLQICQSDLPYVAGQGGGTIEAYEAATEGWEHIDGGWMLGAVKQDAAVLFFGSKGDEEECAAWVGCKGLEDALMLEEKLGVGYNEWPFDQ